MIRLRWFDLLDSLPVSEIPASAGLELLCRQENGRKTGAKKQAEAVTEWATKAKPVPCKGSNFFVKVEQLLARHCCL
jgi:hypothetical protein